MEIPMYDLEVEHIADEIGKRRATRILVQLPDGLRPAAFGIVEALTRLTGAEIFLSGESCYGACDVALSQAEAVGADLIVHYGHSSLMEDAKIPVLYVEAKMDFDARALVEKALPLVSKWRRIGLATTVQHVHKLGEVSETLRRSGLKPVVGSRCERTRYDGQVLGCDYHSAQFVADEVDGYLFVGAGRFHPLGLALATGRPVVMADPYQLSAEMLSEREVKRLAMRRVAAITAARNTRRLGIVVSLKPGQFQLAVAISLQNRLEQKGKSVAVICLDTVGPLQLGGFTEAEAFISTACPRIALDGVADVRQPILTVKEAEVMLGERRWEEIWGRNYFG
jgi:2-(3-amino-3-carboxypropyl)histidine synthase